jgi:hypothetical protein
MSVSNGQPVSAEVVNDAFISRKVNTSASGVVGLLHPQAEISGPVIPNTQKAINTLKENVVEINQEIERVDQDIEHVADRVSSLEVRVPVNNVIATQAPTSSDDETQGYSAGSKWLVEGQLYICISGAQGAAVWESVSADLSEIYEAIEEKLSPIGLDEYHYFGTENLNGSFRIGVINGKLQFEARVNGVWIIKDVINP